jgi:NitT/TauT family transport system substrate-binding protein
MVGRNFMGALTFVRAIMAAIAFLISAATVQAAETVRVGVLKFGTVNWELDTIKHHGLDAAEGIDVEIVAFAGEDATNVALQAGAVDVIVSDWLWVSRQRSAGHDLTFVPFSSSVGAIMVPDASPIASLADLRGKKIGVAGGPLDKGWLLIQGLAKRDFGIELAKEAQPVYGAAPLLAEKAVQGELDAVLNFWHYCAKLEARGFRRLIGADAAAIALGATGRIAAIGYVFHEEWAKAHPAAAIGFVKASRAAKRILAGSDAEWRRLDAIIKSDDAAHLNALMARFREGIPSRPTAEEEADAARLYGTLAELGGERLVGAAMTMSPGTYWATLKHGF